MIGEPIPAAGLAGLVKEETNMLKTLSAALLAATVFAAPALAATRTAQAPATKSTQVPAAKTTQAPVIKADQSKSKVMKANAKMHRKHVRHHRVHKSSLLKAHHTPKVVTKHVAPARRG